MTTNRVRAFKGPNAERDAEKAGHWLKAIAGSSASKAWCIEKRVMLEKATLESVNTSGGFLVPIGLDSAIIAVRDAVGAFRQGAEVRPARSDNTVRPRRVGGLTANFVAESASIPESAFQLDAVGTSLKKQAILARASSELFEDEAAELGEFIAAEIGYAFASVEDDCGFNGDGSLAYRGISGLGPKLVGMKSAVSAAAGHNTFSLLDGTDISNLMAGVLATAIPGAAWYISALGYANVFCRLAQTGGGGLVSTKRPDGTIDASYLGFPVVFSAKLPNIASTLSGKPMLYFGDLRMSSVLVEHRSGTVIATSADRAMDQEQVLVRGIRREDIVNHSVGDASTAGPIAALFAP